MPVASVIRWLREFIREDFEPRLYTATAIFLAAAIAFNYATDFTSTVLFALPFDLKRFGAFFLMLAMGYYLPAIIAGLVKGERPYLSSALFWLKSLCALLILTVNFSLVLLAPVVQGVEIPDPIVGFALRTMVSIGSTIVFLLFALAAKLTYDRDEPGFYGVRLRGVHLGPYLAMLLIVAPLILIASFQPDFLLVYPTYRPSDAAAYLGLPPWLLAVAYEIFYLFDFLFVEIFFRGMLVIAMVRLMGRSAVVPMTVLYAFAHFGKPLGETIAAVFGGYILGVIAYRSCSVVGGFVLHAGIALLMEIFPLTISD